MTRVFISAKAGDHDIALTNSKMVSQKKTERKKDNIPKANKFRYVALLTVTALWGYDHGLLIGNSHGKKKNSRQCSQTVFTVTVYVS